MRKLGFTIVALCALATAYVAYPFVTAWSIREAIHSGNSAYLEGKIEWDSVRASLRQSLSRIAMPEQPALASAAPPAKPGLWARIKTSIRQRAVNGLVDSYVTPERLPQLFEYRQMYRKHVAAEPAPPAWPTRVANFWSRIKRAEFKTPSAFEFEMADRNDPARHYIGLLRLRGTEWKLTELAVRVVQPDAAPVPMDTGAEAPATGDPESDAT